MGCDETAQFNAITAQSTDGDCLAVIYELVRPSHVFSSTSKV